MSIAYIILYLSIFIWLFPPFRQYKGGYFYYFLILAVSDPLMMLLNVMYKIHPNRIYIFISILSFISIYYYWKKSLSKNLLFLFIPALFIASFQNINLITVALFIFHIAIIFVILDIATKDFFNAQRLNFYFILLMLYEATILLKFLNLLLNFEMGVEFFSITTAFGILIGIYFSIFNLEKSPAVKMS